MDGANKIYDLLYASLAFVIRRLCLLSLFLSWNFAGVASASTTYYVDSQNGNDAFTGISPSSAWQSLDKINATIFSPGDSVLFKSGGVWSGMLWPKGSGALGKPITIDRYGVGNKPLFNGSGRVTNVVYLYNQEYWQIRNLEITNRGSGPPTIRRGVYIVGEDFGTLHQINLTDLVIHDVNGTLDDKDNGGIFIEIKGNKTATRFDGLRIEGCHIYDIDRTGISNESSWATRSLTSNTNWVPSLNVVIRNNRIERSGANGLIVRVAAKPLIEHNVFKQCALKGSGNAMFVFNCDDALVQYNEASHTVANLGDDDASGFDADYRCKRSVFQYNYSHDNDDGFMVVVCQGGPTRFNDSTIVRYNISQNDGGNAFRISGQTTNTFIYNNTIYLGPSVLANVILHKSWDAWPDRTAYYNNVIYNLNRGRYNFGSSTNNVFDYNVFFGDHPTNEPNDPHKLISDPKLANPGSGGIGLNTLDGYKLQSDSPCIDSGVILPNHGPQDYWGNKVPHPSGRLDRGAHEYQGTSTGVNDDANPPRGAALLQNYPNPFNPDTNIIFTLRSAGVVDLAIYNLQGGRIKTLLLNKMLEGLHAVKWNGTDARGAEVASGVYFCRMLAQDESKMIKLVLAR